MMDAGPFGRVGGVVGAEDGAVDVVVILLLSMVTTRSCQPTKLCRLSLCWFTACHGSGL